MTTAIANIVEDDIYEEDTQKGKFLTFVLEDETYGIGIEHVTEIIGILPITEVPELPDFIRGIINLRGRIIPVMDMRIRFKMSFEAYNERTCIIVVDMQDHAVGLIVDSVSEVLNIAESDIVEQPVLGIGNSNQYIKGIGKVGSDVKLLLDCDKLLTYNEISSLAEVSN